MDWTGVTKVNELGNREREREIKIPSGRKIKHLPYKIMRLCDAN